MIVVLDFGSQYCHLIARRVRELGVESRILPHNATLEHIRALQPKGIIMSGGPNTVNDATALQFDQAIFESGIPILGLCYSHQLIGHYFGGDVKAGTTSEFGRQEVTIEPNNPLFSGLLQRQTVWMSHADSVLKAPEGFAILGQSESCPNVAMANIEKKIYSTQFHVEVHHTQNGMAILKNFVFSICGAEQNWNTKNYVERITAKLKEQAGARNVLLFVSGGVDSSVCFALLNNILGKERVHGVHIDTGLMRKDESAHIKQMLHQAGFDNLEIVHAQDRFFAALDGVTDPEKKRHIIGDLYLELKDEVIQRLTSDTHEWVFAQGTIYPDTIESGGSQAAHVIKTHHNRVAKVMELLKEGKVLEPLADLYKDEVRDVGRELGIPDELLRRHPFPGPGLGIRVLCSDGTDHVENKTAIESQLQAIADSQEIRNALVHVLPIKSVGVQGDYRTYKHPAVVVGDIEWKKLDVLSTQCTNNVKDINRVLWLVEPKQADFTRAKVQALNITQKRVELLQNIDNLVMTKITDAGLYDSIWQFPVVLLPFGESEKQSVVLRPFQSRDAMTLNVYHMQTSLLKEISRLITEQWGESISYVFYDLTHKPPGTIEWE